MYVLIFNMEVVDVVVLLYCCTMVGCRSQGIGSKLRAGEGAAGRPTHTNDFLFRDGV